MIYCGILHDVLKRYNAIIKVFPLKASGNRCLRCFFQHPFLVHNHFEPEKLEKVVEEMKTLGTPKIRVFDLGFDNLVQAIEGCHRLRACEILEIEPELEYLDGDTMLADLDDIDYDGDAEKVCEVGDWENYNIRIED